jgi:hypothetical protein
MRCETCRGKGNVRVPVMQARGIIQTTLPCPECQGSGLDYCCGGVPHIPYTDCWCKPVEDPEESGVFIHNAGVAT